MMEKILEIQFKMYKNAFIKGSHWCGFAGANDQWIYECFQEYMLDEYGLNVDDYSLKWRKF